MSTPDRRPPKWAHRFLLFFLRSDIIEEVEGDLEEQFVHNSNTQSMFHARLKYWYQVFNYLRPFALKSTIPTQNTNYAMYRNYLKIAYRNLAKNTGYSLINIGGLTIGMTVAMFIGLWVYDELTYNKYHNNYDSIGQVYFHSDYDGNVSTNETVTTGLGTYIKDTYTGQFENVVLVRARLEERLLNYEGDFYIENGYYIQPEGPSMFGLKMIAGSLDGLNDLKTILLSASLARKIFGDENPIGKTVQFDEWVDLEVTGVYQDLPKNSSFHEAAYLAPLDIFLYGWSDLNVWDNQNMYLYVQLREGVKWNEASTLIKNAYNTHLDPGREVELFIHPMSEWHLNAEFENGLLIRSNRVSIIWFYSVIGFAVLLLACVNFMNLSTARSESRAMEIGVRKTMGSARFQLIYQFLSESILVAVIAFLLSLLAIASLLAWFNELAGKGLEIPWSQPLFWFAGFGFTLITGILAGSYPALVLSALNPVRSLKGSLKTGKYATLPRKLLVVFQFTISIALIIGTVIIYQQIQFVKERPVGYLRDGLLMMPKRSSKLFGKYEVLRNELKKTGVVDEIGESNYPLTNTLGNNGGFSWAGKNPNNNITFNTIKVNHDYGNAVGWELIMGRGYSREYKTDNTALVITESAMKKMGLENPIGTVINSRRDYWGSSQFTIIGVVKDLIKGDPFSESRPAFMFLSEGEMRWQFVRLKKGYPQGEAIAKIEEVYREIVPEAYTDFKVVKDEYAYKFESEEKVGQLAAFFSILAILISCLGLFGLAAFITDKRSKEIGIRKVLGASVGSIWRLLTNDFVKLIIISSILAAPIAYYSLRHWISKFDYRMNISLWIVIIVALSALLITLITVSYQAIKAALMNPVNSLRSE